MSETIEQTALAVLPAASLPTILAADKDDILGKLARKVAAFKPDVSTSDGRDEMRSLAYEIARTKTSLVRIGKGLTEDWRKSTKAVNDECKVIEDRMDELRDKVRGPLTEWENREKRRVDEHEAALRILLDWSNIPAPTPAAEIGLHIAALESHELNRRDWQEFKARADDAMAIVVSTLKRMFTEATTREAEAAELAKLRAAEIERQRIQAEQDRRDREARIAAEAAEQAKREAEAKAAEDAARAEREAEDARQALIREAAEREAAIARAADAAAERERKAQADVERLKREAAEAKEAKRIDRHQRALAAIRSMISDNLSPFNSAQQIRYITSIMNDMEEMTRDWEEFSAEFSDTITKGREQIADRLRVVEAQEAARLERQAEKDRAAADKAERDRIAAVEAERKRQADVAAAAKAAEDARAANVAHRTRINREALAGIVLAMSEAHTGSSDEAEAVGKAIITAIAKGQVAHTSIRY